MMRPNSIAPLRPIPQTRRILSAVSIALSLVLALTTFGVPVDTSWTYQGQLRRSGAAYNGTCNFQFSLWDAASGGTQQGSTLAIDSVSVVNGLFTVTLDFLPQSNGTFAFTGDARWLATSVQCSGDGGFTPLDPRQAITAAPYALSLRPGATITGDVGIGIGFAVVNNDTDSISVGIHGRGPIGVDGEASTPNGRGVRGVATEPNSVGIYGFNISGRAILGVSLGGGTAIYGQAGSGFAGQFAGPVDVAGPLTISNNQGVGASGGGIVGVLGSTVNPNGVGVHGGATGTDAVGVWGTNSSGVGVWGQSTGTGAAIYGLNTGGGFAGRFTGPVLIEGNLIVQGNVSKPAGSFRIDHPLDPANKFLSHSFVESPDMKNIYDGNVTTDATGGAIVTLPDYFEALNRDCRYQLTVLGQFAQAIVSRKISGNSFEIRTDKPGVEVSWQVTGIRQDPYAREHPIVVEEAKPAEEQGMYLFPAGFGVGDEKQIGHSSRPAAPQADQKITKITR